MAPAPGSAVEGLDSEVAARVADCAVGWETAVGKNLWVVGRLAYTMLEIEVAEFVAEYAGYLDA